MIAKKLGLPLTFSSARTIFAEMVKAVPEFSGATFGREAPLVQLRFAGSRG
jgi:hypothetical protein